MDEPKSAVGLAKSYALFSQLTAEVVGPPLLGLGLDYWLGCLPWLTVVGSVLGVVGMFAHMVLLSNRPAAPPDKP